ncbi:FecR family protein [Sphingobacterium sp. HMA12]|uniref:FecR family protein n=1 Tax=Sphingobacterium sp. HMA12 TaxID=2050894 RepID=UPI000CEA2EA6|nr:FecR family protein [Sphingobacterium sp. HMA12]
MKQLVTKQLLLKYKQGLCSAEEIALVESWYNALSKENNNKEIPELNLTVEDLHFQNTLFATESAAKRRKRAYLKVAASIVVLLTAGLAIYFLPDNQRLRQQPLPFSVGQFQADLLIGNELITLNDKQHLSNTLADLHGPQKWTVQTKKGQEYQMQLPDGTTVWLNADSRLEIAEHYNQQNRSVFLQGEAYFKVAKNKDKPFIVNVQGTKIEALGTAFNVRLYKSESPMLTTQLDEGKIQVTNVDHQQVLLPGQKIELDLSNGSLQLHSTRNQPDLTAWKNGYFEFDQTPLPQIMADLARWYNFTYTLSPAYKNKVLSGKISKQQPFEEMLHILHFAGINYKIDKDHLMLIP